MIEYEISKKKNIAVKSRTPLAFLIVTVAYHYGTSTL